MYVHTTAFTVTILIINDEVHSKPTIQQSGIPSEFKLFS